MRRCDNGHFYEEKRHSSCPYCGVRDLDIFATKGKSTGGMDPEDRVWRRGPGQAQPGGPGVDPGDARFRSPALGGTVGVFDKGMHGRRAIVGWLVCVKGPDRGRDYRIGDGRNSIGRSESMDVCIAGDQSISRERHAIVSYDPKGNVFKVHAGESHGLVYVDGKAVDEVVVLQPFDRIEIGATQLIFVPFCGDRFRWDVS